MAQPKNINNAILDVLTSIDAKLGESEKQTTKLNTNLEAMASTGVVSESEYESFAKFWGVMARGITQLVKAIDKVDGKTGERFKSFVNKVGEAIADFFENTDKDQVDSFTNLIHVLSKGMLWFAIQMVIAIPFLILAPIGAMLFGLTIRALMWTMGDVGAGKEEQAKGIEAVLGLGRGVLLFALAMILFIPLAPIVAIGVIMFGLVVRLLMWVIGDAGSKQKDNGKGIGAVLDLARGVLWFSLGMILFVLLSPVVIIGTLIFAGVVWLLSWAMGKMGTKEVEQGTKAIWKVTLSILILAATTLIVGIFVQWEYLAKMAAMVGGMALILILVAQFDKQVREGAMAMLIASFAVAIVAIAMLIWQAADPSWESLAKLAVTIGVMSLIATVLGIPPIAGWAKAGAGALVIIGISLIIFSIGLLIFSKAADKLTWKSIGIMGAVIGVMALVATLLGIPPIPGFAAAGAGVLILLGIAFITFSIGFAIFASSIPKSQKEVDLMGSTLTTIGWSFAELALAAIPMFIAIPAMLLASAALLPISLALFTFSKAGWKKKDNALLKGALGAIVSGFLGGEMPGGIIAGIKFAAKAAARAALLFVTTPAFLLAGMALLPITKSLLRFKQAKWSPQDSKNMMGAMGAIISAFALPSDYARQKKMGIYVSPWRLMLGIWALKDAGKTMASLAEGIQAFANLTVPIYGWVENSNGGGTLEVVERRQMSESDFDKAAYGMATVISAIAKPFAEVGRLEKGESSGNPVLDYIFSGNFVSTGISALKNAGATIVGLAEGVQAFAELSIPEYGLVDYTDENGNTNKKLMVIARKAMTTGDIESASANISLVIGVIARALADVGEMEDKSSGWFSGGYVSKGSKALAGAGNNIKAIAEVVANYAKLEHTPMEVVNAGTKDQKLVPGKPVKVTKGEIMAAANTISDVLGVMVKRMAYIGEMESKGGWFFKNNYVKKGVAAIAGMGQNIGAVADAVFKFATGTFQPMTVKNDKLVPSGAPQKVTRAQLMGAASMINDLIRAFGNSLRDFGWWTQQGKNWFWYTLGIEALEKSEKAINKAVNMVKKVTEAGGVEVYKQAADSIDALFTGLYQIFNSERAPDVATASFFFEKFSININRIGTQAGNIVKAGGAFAKMANSAVIYKGAVNTVKLDHLKWQYWLFGQMIKAPGAAKSLRISQKGFTAAVNELDYDKLRMLDSLMYSLAKLGNANVGLDRLGEELGAGMKEGFELLAEYLMQLIQEMQGAGGGAEVGEGGGTERAPGWMGAFGAKVPSKGGGSSGGGKGGGGDMAKALRQALSSVTVTVAPKTGTSWK